MELSQKKTKTNQPKKAILTKASNHRCFLKKCKKYINFTEKHLCLQLRRYKSTRGIPSFFKGWILILVKMGHILRPRKFLISLLVDFLKGPCSPPCGKFTKRFQDSKTFDKICVIFYMQLLRKTASKFPIFSSVEIKFSYVVVMKYFKLEYHHY